MSQAYIYKSEKLRRPKVLFKKCHKKFRKINMKTLVPEYRFS